ncbi:MAG: SCO family protein [Proteobacteria bacterium]|nr:SCO family protein [Pseudomonadota bacterium]
MKLARIAAFALALFVAACGQDKGPWHLEDISGALPPLDFSMVRVNEGKTVSGADYRGKITLLYFGYTQCPDICPTTMANLADVLHQLGGKADQVRVLFVTVDPNRDTPDVLKGYVQAFAPQIDGLRGTPDQIAALARRYRVAYSVTPDSPGHPYEVMHSNAMFVFDRDGKVRLVGTDNKDIDGIEKDLRRLID